MCGTLTYDLPSTRLQGGSAARGSAPPLRGEAEAGASSLIRFQWKLEPFSLESGEL